MIFNLRRCKSVTQQILGIQSGHTVLSSASTQIQEADALISCGMIPIRKQLVIARSTVMPRGTLTKSPAVWSIYGPWSSTS